MKNYLVGATRPVIKHWGNWKGSGDNDQRTSHLIDYENMYRISRASAEKFLDGDWEEVRFTAPVLDARLFQIAHWYMIKELWFKGDSNILVMGSDTMFVKPTKIFNEYREMRLFNYTDPKSHINFEHYFNDDIAYYPANMNPAVWDIGERLMEQWWTHNESEWATGQLIHNAQFWSQQIPIEHALLPHLAWQCFDLDFKKAQDWNNLSVNDANILHLHSSRDTGSRVDVMKQIAKQFNINFDYEEEYLLL